MLRKSLDLWGYVASIPAILRFSDRQYPTQKQVRHGAGHASGRRVVELRNEPSWTVEDELKSRNRIKQLTSGLQCSSTYPLQG
jgi:hypothetical protein